MENLSNLNNIKKGTVLILTNGEEVQALNAYDEDSILEVKGNIDGREWFSFILPERDIKCIKDCA
jgi:hypothetical protein